MTTLPFSLQTKIAIIPRYHLFKVDLFKTGSKQHPHVILGCHLFQIYFNPERFTLHFLFILLTHYRNQVCFPMEFLTYWTCWTFNVFFYPCNLFLKWNIPKQKGLLAKKMSKDSKIINITYTILCLFQVICSYILK